MAAATPDPAVSVVVATRNRPEQLAGLLGALDTATTPDDEIIVVDSASEEPRVGVIARSNPRVNAVRLERPGLSRARNAGVAVATGEIVVFTDDDCRPDAGWTTTIAAAFAAEPKLGFVTGRVRADRDSSTVITTFDEDRARTFRPDDRAEMFGHGANFAVRRSTIEAVGPFDEVLGAGMRLAAGEDTDMFLRILRAGWWGAYVPEASVVHVQWRDRRAFLRVSYNYGLGGAAVAVKHARLDGRRALAPALAECVWRDGVRLAWRDLRAGYETGAIGDLFRAVGGAVGAVVAARLVLDGECFARPDRPRRRRTDQDHERERGQR